MENINRKFKKGLLWSIIGQFGYLGIGFITNVILARILTPQEFGILAITYFFIAITKVLTESGLSGALVRKTNTTIQDYSTIFIFNLVVSIFLYTLLFAFSNQIEAYYQIEDLSLYLRVLGLSLIFNSLYIIHNTKLVKELHYQTISKYILFSISISSMFAIIMAVMGYGIWSLILLQLMNPLILAILYWKNSKGFVLGKFSRKSFKELYSFGLFTTLSSLLDSIFDNIYQLILGKYFNLKQTGFYYQAKRLTEMPVGVINSVTQGVVFSTLSNIQDEKERFDYLYFNVTRIFTIIVGLISLLIFLYAREILFLIYGNKWLGAEFYLKVLSLSYFFFIQEMFNRLLFKVFNKAHLIFILEIVKKIINLISLVVGIYFKSIEVLIYGILVTYALSYYLNYYVSRKIYQSDSSLPEFINLIKVLSAIIIIGLGFNAIKLLIGVENLASLFLLPVVIGIYYYVMVLLRMTDPLRDLYLIKSFKK